MNKNRILLYTFLFKQSFSAFKNRISSYFFYQPSKGLGVLGVAFALKAEIMGKWAPPKALFLQKTHPYKPKFICYKR